MRSLLRRLSARPGRTLLAISLFILAISAARLIKDPPTMATDQTENWWPVVNALLDGQGYVSCLPEYFPFCGPGNNATAMREPVPVLVQTGLAAVSGRSLWAACILQIALNLLVALGLYQLAKRLASTEAGIMAALLWALYIPAYQDLNQVGGDQVAALALMGAFLVLARSWDRATWRDQLLLGALLGLAALSRSALMVFLPAALVAPALQWIKGRQPRGPLLAGMAAAIGAFALVLTPWVVRNDLVFGRPIIGSTLSGYNLYRHNYFLDQGLPPHYVASDEGGRALSALLDRHPELTGHENEAQMDAIYRAEGSAVVKRNPTRYLGAVAFRSLTLWINWRVNDEYGKPSGKLDILLAVEQLVLLGLALVGIRRAGGWRSPFAWGLLLFCLLHMAVVCRMRYLLPVMPITVLFAALALAGTARDARP